MSSVVDRIWAQVEADPKQRNELNDLVRQAMEEWMAKTDRPGDSLIVVFIDDLDRCTSATVLQVFEAVKLYLDAPGFVFVLGWDTEQVLRAVAAEKGGDDRLPQRYVEKIVQFGFRIPRPTPPQLSVLADALCASAGLTDDVLGADDRQLLLNATDGNPRQLKRFINRFVLLHEIVGAAAEPQIVIQLMVLQSSYESFFRLLANVPVETDADNPLFEFADYATAREARSLGRFRELAEILKVRRYETTSDNVEAAFSAFERDLPAEYPALVVDRPFTDLVQMMTDDDKRTLRRLARSEEIAFADPVLGATSTSAPPPAQPPPVTPAAAPEFPRSRSSSKIAPSRHRRTVLWVDDDPEGPNPAVLPDGAELLVARSTDEARRLIAGRSEPVDLLISDIGRGSDPQAGLEGLRHLREDDGYDGPAIFFTLRPTTGQVADARELAAGRHRLADGARAPDGRVPRHRSTAGDEMTRPAQCERGSPSTCWAT